MEDMWLFICVAVMIMAVPVALIVYALTHRRELEEKHERRMAAYRERTDCEADRIVEVKYLGVVMVQKRGGIGGAMLGGFFAGGIGAMVGAALPKDPKEKHRFAVRFGDGRVEIREVYKVNTEYKRLMSMVKWEGL